MTQYRVSADHVVAKHACENVLCEPRQDSTGWWSVGIPGYGHSKNYNGPKVAITAMLMDHACTNIRVVEVNKDDPA